jgi:hypothetical protein
MQELRGFKPDVIIAIGGGSPMDAAKLMWLMYEQPDIKFEEVAARFMVSCTWGPVLLCLHAGPRRTLLDMTYGGVVTLTGSVVLL